VLIENGEVFFAKAPYPCNYFRLRLSSIATQKITEGIEALSSAITSLATTRGKTRMN
jgi:GntR family transcriptional regulator / MocR family aminotransferase